MTALTTERTTTIVGLGAGAAGIAVLWAAGVSFPVAVPPGIVILVAAALLVGLVRHPWSAGVGACVALFVIVGFLASPTGIDNLTGEDGALVALGQAIEVVGVVAAVVAGILTVRAERAQPAASAGRARTGP
ncbi:MAG TPA: hypothetical protein VGO60_11270 [Iamia sp.]|jgi:hypothetical protein|nr:hypothetical protein [Iamia sp.]